MITQGLNDLPFLAASSPGHPLLVGLSAYWKFDAKTGGGTLFPDASSNGLDLLIDGPSNPGNLTTGIINNGYVGQNGTDVLTHANTALLQPGSGSFTGQVWVNYSDPTFQYPAMARWSATDGTSQDFVAGNYGTAAATTFQFNVRRADGVQLIVDTGVPAVAHTWYHLIFGFDQPNAQIFMQVNAGTRFTTSCTNVRTTTTPFTIGNYVVGTSTRALPGTIDECAFWQRLITTAEATTLYRGGAGLPFSSF